MIMNPLKKWLSTYLKQIIRTLAFAQQILILKISACMILYMSISLQYLCIKLRRSENILDFILKINDQTDRFEAVGNISMIFINF